MSILEILQAVVMHATVQTLAGLILADVISGIAAAWKRGDFDLRRTADFMSTNVGPKLLVFIGLRIAALGAPEWVDYLVSIVWLAILAALAGSLRDNISEVLEQPVPEPQPPPHG